MKIIQNIKGTQDILPLETKKWQNLEASVRKVCARFGYEEIRTPIIEKTQLFSRGVGEDTDIVTKEMYTWEDKDGTSLTLRPELTASVARSFIQHNLGGKAPIQRLFYMGPLFRRERPQKGRQRQFHQFGVEAFGSDNPEQDAEIIAIAWHILSECGLNNVASLNLNSIGSSECRKKYREALRDYLKPNLEQLSETSQKRFELNPLRILDTKSIQEQNLLKDAPKISNFFNDNDKEHFDSVQELLDTLNIPFIINEKLVRGLDYYSNTVFEFISSNIGSQDALLGGGRYNHLVESLGGKKSSGIGFAAGMERFLLAMNEQNFESNIDIYFINLDHKSISKVFSLTDKLRKNGFSVLTDTLRRSMKSQLREANRSGAKYAIILGDVELSENNITIKNLKNGEQETIQQNDLINKMQSLTN